MSEIVTASDGAQLDLGNLAQTFGYTGANLTTITVNGSSPLGTAGTYTQTLTWTGGNLTNISGWVKSS